MSSDAYAARKPVCEKAAFPPTAGAFSSTVTRAPARAAATAAARPALPAPPTITSQADADLATVDLDLGRPQLAGAVPQRLARLEVVLPPVPRAGDHARALGEVLAHLARRLDLGRQERVQRAPRADGAALVQA